jgi:hypothetical protein
MKEKELEARVQHEGKRGSEVRRQLRMAMHKHVCITATSKKLTCATQD